jgi:nitrogenase molybdenum-cofactor synthesis protein NifE
MITKIDKLTEQGCSSEKKDKVCRSRGGESCAFDGAMIVLQPIADTAHIVHGPIACCGNSWEGRGTLSSRGNLHRMGFTTDLSELDIIYGAERKLYAAIIKAAQTVNPRAIFVHATCVSGMVGEDIEAVCRDAGEKLGIPVIPVNAPGFVGPKNLGNRIAGEVLLDYVIGTGEPARTTEYDINLIGEYNIAGDLWLVEPVLKAAGISILSRITGDGSFEEITFAHRAKLNVVVCSRAVINTAKEMERKYGIPYVEVSFFGKSEMSKALRQIGSKLAIQSSEFGKKIEQIIEQEEQVLEEKLKPYSHLIGRKAMLYTGGVKSWSFISALLDLGMEVVGVGTKKSTAEDEEKMREILGPDAPLIEDVTPKNLLRLLRERDADILVAGGRNQYLAVKEGYPFVDVNQERHTPYAGYKGLVNLAEAISNSLRFYRKNRERGAGASKTAGPRRANPSPLVIDPLKHSQSIGAVMAFQGIHRAVPVIHGAQGCTFLAKVLLTKHFKEPIALAGTKLFAEDVVMGSDENLIKVVRELNEKNNPDIIGLLTSGLSEVKGDDVSAVARKLEDPGTCRVIPIPSPDYEDGLETGYSRAVEGLLGLAENVRNYSNPYALPFEPDSRESESQVNVLVGPHLTPADFTALREMVTAFGLKPIVLPDLAALDGSRQGVSPLALGGTTLSEIRSMGSSGFTIAIGMSMESPARLLKERFGVEYCVLESLAGLKGSDVFMEVLEMLSSRDVPEKYLRQRRILIDGMRDAHFFTAGKKASLALEPDHAVQLSGVVHDMAMDVNLAVIPTGSAAAEKICAEKVMVGDLSSLEGGADILISTSHAEDTAKKLRLPLLQTGFPVYTVLGQTAKVTIGYQGTLTFINDMANLLAREAHV